MDAPTIISIISVIIAIISIFGAWYANDKVVKIEEKRDEEKRIEAKKANVLPEIVDVKISNIDWTRLRLTNHGNSVAKNVQVFINGKSVKEEPLIRSGITLIPLLAPGASFNYNFTVCIGDVAQEYYNILVKWDDDFSENRQNETTLSYIL